MPRVDLISANIAPKVGLTIIEVFIGTRQTLRHAFIMSYRLFPLEGYTYVYYLIALTCLVCILNNAHLNIRSNFGTVRPVYEN